MRGNSRIVSAQRRMSVRVSRVATKAYLREYPEPEFIAEVKEAFPEQPIANVEEARVCDCGVVFVCMPFDRVVFT